MSRTRTADTAASLAFRHLTDVCGDVAADRSVEQGRALPPGVWHDSRVIVDLVDRHRVTTLAVARFAHHMRNYDPAAANRLLARVGQRRMAGLHRAARLAAISRALSAAGIRHLCIKGAVLSQQLYGDVAARDSKDIDLLIDPSFMVEAGTVLRGMGFAQSGSRQGADGGRDFGNKHRSFVSEGLEVELHSRLLTPMRCCRCCLKTFGADGRP